MKLKTVIAVFLLFVSPTLSAQACTLFAATGADWVKGGGTLITKNRDWEPTTQDLWLVTDGGGFRYYALVAQGRGNDGNYAMRCGINEKGLVVIQSTAGTIPRKNRLTSRSRSGVLRPLLSKHSSVDEALKDRKIFTRSAPQNVIIADKTKIACIEIGLDGKISVEERVSGALYHTNHYVMNDMLLENQKKPGISSLKRYNRIKELLETGPKPYTLADFIRFSDDRENGPYYSIWHEGKQATSSQSVSVMSVYLPIDGEPVMYVKMRRNPDEQGQEEVLHLTMKDMFGS